ncbi:thioredoxin domain-containing protein [Gracilimonas sp.]|uniref:DsbA family protein n=1 Tax=Gracilimonas sp. TaxID=1974203 RepID=UPI0032EC4E6E
MKRGLFLLTLFAILFSGTALAQDSGESDAQINIVKFSDYQCPACKYFVSIEEQLKQEYGDEISITTKHFPLNMHEHAQLASRVAEAAREQGKYQEMHDMIFTGQEQWARGNAEAIFIGYAKSLSLDMEQFRNDMNSADMQRKVMADKREGLNLNVNSTPTFFINGTKVENNPRTFEQFKQLIEAMTK